MPLRRVPYDAPCWPRRTDMRRILCDETDINTKRPGLTSAKRCSLVGCLLTMGRCGECGITWCCCSGRIGEPVPKLGRKVCAEGVRPSSGTTLLLGWEGRRARSVLEWIRGRYISEVIEFGPWGLCLNHGIGQLQHPLNTGVALCHTRRCRSRGGYGEEARHSLLKKR